MKLLPLRIRLSDLFPLVLLGAMGLLPLWAAATGEAYYLTLVGRILIYAIAATALHFALGLAGLASLGHALFLGVGAYCVALSTYFGHDSGLLHLGLAVAACGLLALITGAISLRTSGMGFLMITLAFAQMGYFFFVSLKQFGGDDGLAVKTASSFGGFTLSSPERLYWVSYAVLIIATVWTGRLQRAPVGMVLLAAEQNARRVQALGLSVWRYRLAIFVLSGVVCGIAGVLLANLTMYVSPTSMSLQVSGDLVVMLVLGGVGYRYGPVLGAVTYLAIEELLKGYTEHWMLLMGPAIVLVALLGRGGIAGLFHRMDARLMRPRPVDSGGQVAEAALQRESGKVS
ncbi:MAG: Amino acid/amide transporter rane protein 2, family [Ramlibacter sp.]|jgi:branched-chain amino acid transport system permease protein|nr:Amino acid/amide transporter rane protein 2, family [Ramlibacter sp.]